MLQTRTPQAFSSTPLHSLARAQFVVMLRRVLVVAGLAQLSRASASLARTQCRHHLLLASRSRPSASLLGKPWLHHATKPPRCLSAAHCFSSSTTTTVRATLSPSINHLEEGKSLTDDDCIVVVSGRFVVVVVIEWLCEIRSNTSRYDDMVMLVTQLRYARISARLLYRISCGWFFSCICSATANSHS